MDPAKFIDSIKKFVEGNVTTYLKVALTDSALPQRQKNAVKSLIDAL